MQRERLRLHVSMFLPTRQARWGLFIHFFIYLFWTRPLVSVSFLCRSPYCCGNLPVTLSLLAELTDSLWSLRTPVLGVQPSTLHPVPLLHSQPQPALIELKHFFITHTEERRVAVHSIIMGPADSLIMNANSLAPPLILRPQQNFPL